MQHRLMICPTCEEPFAADSSPALPFCSQRCRQVDLGRWLDERQGVPIEPDGDDGETSLTAWEK